MKKIKLWCVVLSVVAIVVGGLSFFVFYQKEEAKKLEAINRKRKVVEISKHYNSNVLVKDLSPIYKKNGNKYVKVGEVSKDEVLTLGKTNIDYRTKYFYIPQLDSFIDYKNVIPSKTYFSHDQRYKNYLVFNENVVTKDNVHLYRGDKLVYTLNYSLTKPIIQKDDLGYFVEFSNELFLIPKEDVVRVDVSSNTNEEEAIEVPVTVYHFIYLEGDNTCNEMICHHENQIREQFQYLKEQNYFTLNTKELGLFLEGKIRVPKNSILITIDDGARAEKFIPLLEEYKINATLFLISSWYPTDKFKSSYLELASHTHDLHKPGKCPGGQGSPLKCLDRNTLLDDLRKSRETLNGTEAFCFPFYEYNDYALEVIKEAGFKLGFIGGMRKVNRETNPLKIPRISMNSGTTLKQYINYIR